MTIAVTIENTDKTKTVEVIEKTISRQDGGLSSFGSPFPLQPGEKRTFHCYLLRELIVRERHPDRRD